MMSFFAKSDMTGLRNLWLLFGGVHFCKFANRDCRIEAIVSQMEILSQRVSDTVIAEYARTARNTQIDAPFSNGELVPEMEIKEILITAQSRVRGLSKE